MPSPTGERREDPEARGAESRRHGSFILHRREYSHGELLAGVAFAARHEAVEHLTDILLNRTGIGRRGDPGEDVLTAAAHIAGAELDWTPDRRAAELDAPRTAVRLPD
ncbi:MULTISPECIES: glycerol-3-phosphate dehydrogenase C-terminal domain-containing protein [Microbacterium]|uniref:glycerol-3-phosphate dehydrogenase C-terminal domain-containing protein n=1 Tax=Microbacterium TaxID=33882 RepID=UPI00344F3A12